MEAVIKKLVMQVVLVCALSTASVYAASEMGNVENENKAADRRPVREILTQKADEFVSEQHAGIIRQIQD